MAGGHYAWAPFAVEKRYKREVNGTTDKVAEAVRLQALGKTVEAEALLEEALAADPTHIDAQMHLAVLYMHEGRFDKSADAFSAVLEREPKNSRALANLGTVLQASGQIDAAEAIYERALVVDPGLDPVHLNLGHILLESGRAAQAIEHIRAATEINPSNTNALHLLASTLIGQGGADEIAEAKTALQAWQALEPDNSDQYFLIGAALLVSNDVPGAIPHLTKAADQDPERAAATLARALIADGRPADGEKWFTTALKLTPDKGLTAEYGQCLRSLGRLSEARDVFRGLLAVDPKFAPGHLGLGNVLQAECRHDEAIAEFEAALAVNPADAPSLANKATSLQFLGRPQDALATYERAVEADPTAPEIRFNQGALLQGMGRFDEAQAAFRRALDLRPGYAQVTPYLLHMLLKLCDWGDLKALTAEMEANTRAELAQGKKVSAAPFSLCGTAVPFDLQMDATRSEAAAIGAHVAETKARMSLSHAPRGEKLRVGYISPDLRSHSAGRLFQSLLRAHDRSKLEITGYSLASTKTLDETTEWFKTNFDGFRDLSLCSHEQSASLINGDGINILVDLASHTKGARPEILALEPAPVQCHYLGYNLPLGAEWCRYMIGDRVSFADQKIVSELPCDLVLLDGAWAATEPPAPVQPMTRAEAGLPETGFVFANFNAPQKCEPIIWGVWMRILAAVPGSILWMLGAGETVKRNLRQEAEIRGVAADRIVFAPPMSHDQHLRRLALADVAFDTHHYKGGATPLEFLGAAVPVVTLLNVGPAWGASLLHAAGVPETAAKDIADYERIAVDLANDPDKLADIKSRLKAAPHLSPKPAALYDTQKWTRDVEAALEKMWADFQTRSSTAP